MFQRVEPVHPSLNYAHDFPNIQFPRNVTPKVMTDSCCAVGTAASVDVERNEQVGTATLRLAFSCSWLT